MNTTTYHLGPNMSLHHILLKSSMAVYKKVGMDFVKESERD